MTRNRLVRAWMIAAAIAVALPAAPVSATPVADDGGLIKDVMCSAAGCSRGERKCADVKGEIKDPTGRGTVSVTWYCYEGVVGEGGWEV